MRRARKFQMAVTVKPRNTPSTCRKRLAARDRAPSTAAVACYRRAVPEPLIRFKNVQKAFGDKVIYRGVDLDVYPGETITIMGGSGVGKSVLL